MNSPLASANFLSFCVKEEEALIAAHRKEIEDTMEIVREVSKISNNILKLNSFQNLGIFVGALPGNFLYFSDMHSSCQLCYFP